MNRISTPRSTNRRHPNKLFYRIFSMEICVSVFILYIYFLIDIFLGNINR